MPPNKRTYYTVYDESTGKLLSKGTAARIALAELQAGAGEAVILENSNLLDEHVVDGELVELPAADYDVDDDTVTAPATVRITLNEAGRLIRIANPDAGMAFALWDLDAAEFQDENYTDPGVIAYFVLQPGHKRGGFLVTVS